MTFEVLLAAAAGAMIAGGLLLAVWSWTPRPERSPRPTRQGRLTRWWRGVPRWRRWLTLVALLAGLMIALSTGFVVAVVMFSVSAEISRGRFRVGSGFYTMGAALWWRDFGWEDSQLAVLSIVILTLGAITLAAGRITVGLTSRGDSPERFRAALGGIARLGRHRGQKLRR
jgi:hypothetical protein